MITRAQAEALLTLAESLEACERLGLGLNTCWDGSEWIGVDKGVTATIPVESFTSLNIRLAVNDLIPKHTGS